MQLPHGTLTSSHKGAADLALLGDDIAKDALNGYLRVSVFDRSAVRECVIVYLAGRPVMAFSSDGAADHADPGFKLMDEAIRKGDAIVEVCQIQEKQVRLLQDIYREFAVSAPASVAPVVPAKPTATEQPKIESPPEREEKRRPARMPEIRGRFARAESVGDIDEYLRNHPGDTGHLLFTAELNGRREEEHIILIKGKIEAAYNDHVAGPELLETLKGVSGQAEFFMVDETLLTSIIGRYAGAASRPTAEKRKPAPGILAKDLLEASRPQLHISAQAREDTSRTADEFSGNIDDDIAMVRRVENEFASHVDELLIKLELSHLRSRKKR